MAAFIPPPGRNDEAPAVGFPEESDGGGRQQFRTAEQIRRKPGLLLACDYVEFDHSGNVSVKADVGLVGTNRLDVCRQFYLALVDFAKASGLNSIGYRYGTAVLHQE